MRTSVFSTLAAYIRGVLRGVRSVWKSGWTAMPYLFSVHSGDLRKEVTEQYPDPVSSRTADDLPPRTRGLLFNDIERCTGCKDCEQVCPSKCITIENELGADAQKTWVAVFDIDFARCMFCGLCVEVCQPQSIVHTKQLRGRGVYAAGSGGELRPRARDPGAAGQVGSAPAGERGAGGHESMTLWVCSVLTLGGALMACLVSDLRRAVLALWVCSLGVGGLYLYMGAELLAVVQWIASTLIAIAFVFYAVMFGEYGVADRRSLKERVLSAALPVCLGAAFAGVVWLGGSHLTDVVSLESKPLSGQDVSVLGKALAEDHLLSLEILALTLFLVIVGSGVVARPESRPSPGRGP